MKSTNEEGLIRDACDLRHINQLGRVEDSLRSPVHGLEIQSATVIRHKPGKRCLIKYSGIDAEGLQFKFLGKMRFKGLDRYSPAIQRELFMNGFDGAEGFSVPQVYGELPSLNMWLQEFMHNAFTLSVESRKFIAAQKRVALTLSRLHRSSIAPAKLYTLDDELALLGVRFQTLKQSHPQLTKLVDSLQAKVSKIAAALRPSTHQTIIHRDFYFEQILISKAKSP
jgi:hypothetical protein